MPSVKLICLPYAGGNAYSFSSFRKYLDGKVIMITPELPGRGVRYSEPLISDIYSIADDLFEQLAGEFNSPYALYGHSMGGIAGYLLAHRIKKEGLMPPLHFFCSGSRAPSVVRTRKYHNLPETEFIAKLRELGGSPDEVLNNAELMEFYLPIIRADFEAIETYEYKVADKLDVPVTVFAGSSDKINNSDIVSWQAETTQPISILNFSGGHFFILEQTYELCRVILRRLAAHLVA